MRLSTRAGMQGSVGETVCAAMTDSSTQNFDYFFFMKSQQAVDE